MRKINEITQSLLSILVLSIGIFLLMIWVGGFSWGGLFFSITLAVVITGLLKLDLFIKMRVKKFLDKTERNE